VLQQTERVAGSKLAADQKVQIFVGTEGGPVTK